MGSSCQVGMMKASIALGLALTTLLVHAQQAPGQTGGETGSGRSYGYGMGYGYGDGYGDDEYACCPLKMVTGSKDPGMDGLYRIVMKADWSVNLPAKCNSRCVYQKDGNGNGMGGMGSGYGMGGMSSGYGMGGMDSGYGMGGMDSGSGMTGGSGIGEGMGEGDGGPGDAYGSSNGMGGGKMYCFGDSMYSMGECVADDSMATGMTYDSGSPIPEPSPKPSSENPMPEPTSENPMPEPSSENPMPEPAPTPEPMA